MATSFKTLKPEDIQTTRTNLHEAIPVTGSIVSGTYSENNIKNYSHGMFQSVYDFPYLSSSANHIFDLTAGLSSDSALSGALCVQVDQKMQIYNELAQVLVGHDVTGAIEQFDEDGNFASATDKMKECIFINVARLLSKDEVKKGTFSLVMNVDPHATPTSSALTKQVVVTDKSGSDGFRVNSPAGEYGILYASGSSSTGLGIMANNIEPPCGLLFYQAGVVVLTGSLFKVENSGGLLKDALVDQSGSAGKIQMHPNDSTLTAGSDGIDDLLQLTTISSSADAMRQRMNNLSFNNTTELNSTVYFCRANSREFNYSSNPTYLSQSQIRTKETRTDEPISYATTVGLYGENNELLAVAKLSEPLKKTPANEFTLRVRLDY